MFANSLVKLSSKVVAKCLAEDRYKHLDSSLEAPLSDEVFLEIMEIPSASSPVIAKETGLKLNLTKFDSEGLPISYEDLVNLHSHDIRTLAIALQDLFEVPEYIIETDEEDEDQIDIVRVLKTCLNERSRQNLRHLSCDFFECFPDDWAEKNLRLIDCFHSDISETQLRILVGRNPSLETIALLETPCDRTDFSDLPITVLNMANYESTMNTLHYALDKRVAYVFCSRLSESINRLAELLEIEDIQGSKENEYLKMMMEVADKCPRLGGEKDGVAKCLIPYFKHIFFDQSITEMLQKLDSRDPLFVERRWAAQTVLRFFPEP